MLAVLLAVSSFLTPAAPRHHGLYLHADLGLGYYASMGQGASITAPAGGVGLSIGGTIAENLALFATLYDAVGSDPTLHAGGVTTRPGWDYAGIGGFGVGLAYYFMPSNLYVTGSLGAGPMTIQKGDTTYSSHVGLAGRVGAGKEWFVSESWGLGLVAFFNFGFHGDQSPGGAFWSTVSPTLAFSATFY
jgi:hypothetical protein